MDTVPLVLLVPAAAALCSVTAPPVTPTPSAPPVIVMGPPLAPLPPLLPFIASVAPVDVAFVILTVTDVEAAAPIVNVGLVASVHVKSAELPTTPATP